MMAKREWWARTTGALAVLCALAAAAAAQDGASISGTVKDQGGLALPGVTVTALNSGSGRETMATSVEAGRYEVKGLVPGTYRVIARLQGFSDAGRSVTLSAGEAATRDFTMGVGNLSEEITITATRSERATAEIPQMITITWAEDIEKRRPAGIQEVLERTPNVRTVETNPFRARPQLRGLDSTRVAIMVDGERLNNTRFDVGNTGISPNMVDVNHLEAVEVVAGASSSLYGSDAMAGTINLLTKTPRAADGRTELGVRGDFDYHTNSDYIKGGLSGSLAGPKFALRTTYSRFDLDNYEAGDEAVPIGEVVRLGSFATEMGNAVASNVAASFGVFDLPAGAEIPSGGAEGYNLLADGWLFPTRNQTFRLKYLRSRHENLGVPFTGPPYAPLRQTNSFRNYDKVSARYERLDLASWLSRLSVGGYRQNFNRPQDDLRSEIVAGSSFTGAGTAVRLTGNPSRFVPGINNFTENDVTSYGVDLHANFLPWKGVTYTTGVAYLREESRDTFTREARLADGSIATTTGLKTAPDTNYANRGWFNQVEWSPISYVRLSGGFRVDNWKTEGVSSPGFPAGNEGYVLNTALPQIRQNPGSVNVAGVEGIQDLFGGSGKLETDSTKWTGNVGAAFPLAQGIVPFVRYGTSYREPEVTVRYLVRNFGSPVFSVPSLPNTVIEAEEGKNLDVGVKLDRRNLRASFAYFKNDITGFSQTIFQSYCLAANPSLGVLPTPFPPCVASRTHQAQFFQRVAGSAKARFSGYEAMGEASIPLGSAGSLTPLFSLGWLKSVDEAPSATDRTIVQRFFNRSETPIKLEGGIEDIPARNVIPFQGTVALRFTDRKGRVWVEYEWRFTSDITKVDPESTLASPNITQYGTLRSLEGYDRHALRASYAFKGRVPARLSFGIENLTNAFFFLPFQNAPEAGRTFIFGLSFDWRTGI